MPEREQKNITVLDAGSVRVRALSGEIIDGAIRYLGHSVANARGIRRSIISDLTTATESFDDAFQAVEDATQTEVANSAVGVGGSRVRGVTSRGGILLGSRMREITRDDVRAAVERAREVHLPAEYRVLHLLPQDFLVDDQDGILDPVGMIGSTLEVNLHIVMAPASTMQNVVTCANKAGVEVSDTIFEAIASAEAVLTADERELGVCVLDIGAASTEVAVLFEGAVVHTDSLPIGGSHFTNDLAVVLRVPLPEAERLKLQYGHTIVTAIPQSNEVLIMAPDAGDGQYRQIPQRHLSEILEPRARELFQMLRNSLRQGGVLEAMGSGCVLTGGGAKLPGMAEHVENMLRTPARIGMPVPLSRMPEELVDPEFATLVGLLLYAHRVREQRGAEDVGLGARLKAIFAGSI
ncbi:MAG TPA: cell division protein FtsA [Acidobacteriaceae bacterium]|nr:cell division protein FtsA [Acidobacteriaceae bacterium]